MSRLLVLGLLVLGSIQCGGGSTPAATSSAPTLVDAAVEAPKDAIQDSGVATAAPDTGPPPPAAQDVCMDASGKRLVVTLKVPGCGPKLGKTRTDEGRPGVVSLYFAVKSTCTKMEPVTIELMTDPLQQRRFQLTVEDDTGHVYADQMVTTTSAPACGAKKK